MTKIFFVAQGFKIEGSNITFGSPSDAIAHLTSAIQPGDGVNIIAALEGPTGHATDHRGFDVFRQGRELDWHMRGVEWTAHVIVQEPLLTVLLAELRKL